VTHIQGEVFEKENRARLTCKRIVITHTSEDVLSRASEVGLPMAEDRMTVLL